MNVDTVASLIAAILVFWGAYLNYRVSQMNSDSADAFKQGMKEGKEIGGEITATVERIQAGYEGILRQQRELHQTVGQALDRTLTTVNEYRRDVRDAHTRLLDIIQEKW